MNWGEGLRRLRLFIAVLAVPAVLAFALLAKETPGLRQFEEFVTDYWPYLIGGVAALPVIAWIIHGLLQPRT